MKYCNINERFTNLVTEYIGKGYKINTASMGGSQGEIAKVDLTDGKEIIRVMIDTFSDWEENAEGIELIVGKSTDDVKPNANNTWATVWSSHLEVIYRERFYKIGADRKNGTEYGTKEEAASATNLRYQRRKSRSTNNQSTDITDKAMNLAKQIIRREFGAKRISKSDITVKKVDNRYTVHYRGKSYQLH